VKKRGPKAIRGKKKRMKMGGAQKEGGGHDAVRTTVLKKRGENKRKQGIAVRPSGEPGKDHKKEKIP